MSTWNKEFSYIQDWEFQHKKTSYDIAYQITMLQETFQLNPSYSPKFQQRVQEKEWLRWPSKWAIENLMHKITNSLNPQEKKWSTTVQCNGFIETKYQNLSDK